MAAYWSVLYWQEMAATYQATALFHAVWADDDEPKVLKLAHNKPQGAVEEILAEHIAQCASRLRRVVRTEASIFNDGQQDAEQDHRTFLFSANTRTTVGMGDVFNKVETHKSLITNISKYEAHLERSLYRALRELQRLQLTRSGARIPAPIAIDVQFAGGLNE